MLARTQFMPFGDGLEKAHEAQQCRLNVARLNIQRQRKILALAQARTLTPEGSREFEFSGARVAADQLPNTGTASRRGIVDAFAKICERWGLHFDEMMILLGYQTDHVVGQQVLAGGIVPTSQDVRDRVGYVIGISLGLGALFGEVVRAEIDWLKYPRAELNGMSPLEHMLEGHMASLLVVAEMVKQERGL